MKNPKWLDFVVGLFVLSGIVAFGWLAFNASNSSGRFGSGKGIAVTANFDNIGSLKVKAPVMVSGVRVGQVAGIELDPQTFQAVVRLNLDTKFGIPTDTIAAIHTSGLVGEQYIALDPGGSEQDLTNGDRIRMTQDAFVMERLIGQLLASFTGGKDKDESSSNDRESDEKPSFSPGSLLD